MIRISARSFIIGSSSPILVWSGPEYSRSDADNSGTIIKCQRPVSGHSYTKLIEIFQPRECVINMSFNLLYTFKVAADHRLVVGIGSHAHQAAEADSPPLLFKQRHQLFYREALLGFFLGDMDFQKDVPHLSIACSRCSESTDSTMAA